MEFLINITLKATIILLFSGSILLCLKNASATLRHWIISLTMIGLLGMPILLGVLPSIQIVVPYLPTKQQDTATNTLEVVENPEKKRVVNTLNLPIEVGVVPKDKKKIIVDSNLKIVDNQSVIVSKIAAVSNETRTININQLLVIIWCLGMLFFFVRLLIGRYAIQNITIKSEPFWLSENLRKQAGSITQKKVQYLINTAIKTPMTWGGFKPVVLLPVNAKKWSETELKTVLIHELNHIKRNDYWLHTLGLLTVCLYWFHPLIWLMKKQQLLEREKACDEAVIRAGIQQQNYAEQLVNIAKQLMGKTSMIKETALPMAKISQTKARVLAILNFDAEAFRFSKWRQWNWGILYAFLFPLLAAFSPVGKVIQQHFELAKLENIKHFLATNNIADLAISTPVKTLTKEVAEPNLEPVFSNMTVENLEKNIYQNTTLEVLEKESHLLTVNLLIEKIDLPQRPQKARLHGQWKEGRSEFTIWIDGEFRIIEEAPYFEVVSDDGIVIIEEYEDGLLMDKVHKLLLTKAPYDGRMRSLNWRKSIFDSPLIEKGTPIKIWDRIFSNGSYDKWMKTKGHQVARHIASKKQDYFVQTQTSTNREWSQKVEKGRGQVDFHFIPENDVVAKKERQRRRTELQSGKIPYRKLAYPIEEGQSSIIGRTNLSGKDMGNDWLLKNWSSKGTQYITVLEGNAQSALIKAFNFHISKNDFQDLSFELQLYNVVDNEIQYAITKSPIPIQLKEGSGWIKKDLSSYGIVTQGDVLVVLENKDFSGPKNGKGLYFSLTDDYEAYEAIISSIFKWKNRRILEQAFVMNLEIEQHLDKIGVLEKSASKTRLQPDVSSVSAEAIVKAAVNKLTDNYIQKPHTADLYYRYSSLSPSDSLAYQSEAVLKYYDSKGYQKRGWRNAANSRYAKLEEGRITVGEQKEKMKLSELGRFFVFWSHEPIITNDKPLSESSMGAYEYKLIGTKEFMGQQVFEIEFVCTKLKDRFAGLPSLKYMKGKLYINQADYAIVRYEQQNLMDYQWTGKHPKKRGHLKERNIIESSRIEIFSKKEAGYYLDYSKEITKQERQHTLLDGKKEIDKGKFMEEYQYFNIITEKVERLNENLFKFNKETTYNPDYWEQFHIVLNENGK